MSSLFLASAYSRAETAPASNLNSVFAKARSPESSTFDVTDYSDDGDSTTDGDDDGTDPTDDPKDNVFINLTTLKTACVIIGSEVRTEASNAISIKDGPSAIDLRGVATTLTMLYKDLCEKYDQLVYDYVAGGSLAGQAILGPYSPGSDFVSRTHSDYDHRGGYFRY